MQVILLAAGRSTRLAPIKDKNTLEFSGKTLIEHQVGALKTAKLRDIVVVGGAHNLDKLKSILRKYNNVMVVEQKNLDEGMAGGVLAGAKHVQHKNILVMSVNDVFEPVLFEKLIEASKEEGSDGVIVGTKVETYFPGGYVEWNKQGYLTNIIEKPVEGKEPSKYVNIVLHVYNNFPKFAEILKKTPTKKGDGYEAALDTYVKKQKAKINVLKYHGYWQPIKYPWHILRAMEYFLSKQEPRIDRSAQVAKSATLSGNVVIGPNARVMDHATLKGPVYVGEGSVVACNALVRDSMIGSNCVVGFSTEVARSYLNDHVWTHSNYIGDSIVDSNVSFGAGTVLGNLRFDEGNVQVNVQGKRVDSGMKKLGAIIGHGARFGIKSCTNPGVMVGANSFIGGNVLVDEDIPENKLVLLKQQLKVVSNIKTADAGKRKKVK